MQSSVEESEGSRLGQGLGVLTMLRIAKVLHLIDSVNETFRLPRARFAFAGFELTFPCECHAWCADIDESGVVICDESMPLALLHAIRQTASPASTLSDLTRLIQAEVDIQMPTLHRENRRRFFAIPAMIDSSVNHQLGFAK